MRLLRTDAMEVERMRILIMTLAVLLSGCAQLAQITPSLQYCDRVEYLRQGNQITLKAECAAPIGGGVGL